MIDNKPEITPRPVEEMALKSANETTHEFVMRIRHLKQEATWRSKVGIAKLALGAPFSIGVTAVGWSIVLFESNEIPERLFFAGVGTVGAFALGLFLGSGAEDINQAAMARGEINSLTTAIASHIIAEST